MGHFKVFIEFVTILPLFYVWLLGPEACGILTPWQGIQPATPCIGRWRPNRWTTGEVPNWDVWFRSQSSEFFWKLHRGKHWSQVKYLFEIVQTFINVYYEGVNHKKKKSRVKDNLTVSQKFKHRTSHEIPLKELKAETQTDTGTPQRRHESGSRPPQ